MKPQSDKSYIEAIASTPDMSARNKKHKSGGRKKCPGGLSADAQRLAEGAAALEQRGRLVDERTSRASGRI